MRWLALLILVACTAPDRTPDPAVGRWAADSDHIIELRADGTLDMPATASPECSHATAVIDACHARERWTRSGSIVTLERAAISSRSGLGVSKPGPCECRLEGVEVQLRGDELIAGKQHAQRVK